MARLRQGSPPADLRAALAEKDRESFARYHAQLDPGGPPRVSAKAVALEAGEPVEFHGWELSRFVPGVDVYARYRVNRDGSVDEVDDTATRRGEFPRPVRADDQPAPPAKKEQR